jgi:hypothetical protein
MIIEDRKGLSGLKSAFFRDPARIGRRKNSAGSTTKDLSQLVDDLPSNEFTARSSQLT